MKDFEDTSIMLFGKHKGKRLIDVPDNYLIWWYGENKHRRNHPLVIYIKDSLI